MLLSLTRISAPYSFYLCDTVLPYSPGISSLSPSIGSDFSLPLLALMLSDFVPFGPVLQPDPCMGRVATRMRIDYHPHGRVVRFLCPIGGALTPHVWHQRIRDSFDGNTFDICRYPAMTSSHFVHCCTSQPSMSAPDATDLRSGQMAVLLLKRSNTFPVILNSQVMSILANELFISQFVSKIKRRMQYSNVFIFRIPNVMGSVYNYLRSGLYFPQTPIGQ